MNALKDLLKNNSILEIKRDSVDITKVEINNK